MAEFVCFHYPIKRFVSEGRMLITVVIFLNPVSQSQTKPALALLLAEPQEFHLRGPYDPLVVSIPLGIIVAGESLAYFHPVPGPHESQGICNFSWLNPPCESNHKILS